MEALESLIRSNALPASYRQMVDRIHRPVAERIAQTRRAIGRPIVAGLCGSQGSGKSTMAAFLKALLEAKGLKTAILSIDDLYLTLPERERLAAEVHPLLKTRGVPGTHDLGLGQALIDVLTDGVAEVSMPRFDKAEDTRAPGATWPRVASPVDVILLEGRFEVVSAAELGLPEPDETETTFVGNAVLKARAAADRSGLIALADDSGLSVSALDGAPGIFSARWAGPAKDFTLAMDKVRERLEEVGAEDMSAWFSCALAVAWPRINGNGGPVMAVEGRVDGTLTFPARGTRGFGYDPIFVPENGAHTFGEMDPAAKDAISHRARAFAQLKAALFD